MIYFKHPLPILPYTLHKKWSFLLRISSVNGTKSAGSICAVLSNYLKNVSIKKFCEKEKYIGVNFIGIDIPLKNTCANFQLDMTFFFINHLFEKNTFSEVNTYQMIKMNLVKIYCSNIHEDCKSYAKFSKKLTFLTPW